MADAIPPTSPTAVAEQLGTSGAPPDNLGGSEVPVGGGVTELHQAINGLGAYAGQGAVTGGVHNGNTYVVPPGVNYDPPTLPLATTGWTCIRSSSGSLPPRGTRVTPAHDAALFKMRSPVGAAFGAFVWVIPEETQGWRIIGADIAHGNTNTHNTIIQDSGRRMLYERCHIHHYDGAGLERGMRVLGGDWQMWDSLLDKMHSHDSETQCIWFSIYQSNAALFSRFHMENSRYEGAGENILLGDQSTYQPTRDVTVKRCHLFKPLSWWQSDPSWDGGVGGVPWNVKNSFESKHALKVLFEGNTVENCWIGGQDGTAFVALGGRNSTDVGIIDKRTEDLMVRSNHFKNVESAFTFAISGGFGEGMIDLPNRIAVMNNLLDGVRDRFLFLNYYTKNLRVEHNTGLRTTAGVSRSLLIHGSNNTTIENLTVKRNVWSFGGGVQIDQEGGVGNMTDAQINTTYPSYVRAENAQFDGTQSPAMTGYTSFASAAAAGINPTTGALASNSQLRAGGANGGSDGKDIGVDFDELADDMAGTPQPPIASFEPSQDPTGLTVQFQDTSV